MSRRGALLVGLGVFALAAACALALVGAQKVPDYGVWTGIRPLERKVELLEDFAKRGEVDAIAIGSSIVDFGFSAELFSRLMSERLGREWRMYNFATGGAEPRTLPDLYRFARLAAKPKAVFVIAPPEPRLREDIYPQSPDYILERAPVSAALGSVERLRWSRAFWGLPFIRNAPAVRDKLLFGNYRNIQPAVGMEAYDLSPNGDRVSLLAAWGTASLEAVRQQTEAGVPPHGGPAGEGRIDRMLAQYFARRDAEALRELGRLVRADGGKLYVIVHGNAATFWRRTVATPAFAQGRRDFFEAFASALGADGLWDLTDTLSIPTYAVSDVTHLNAYGAELYTRAAFAAFTGTAFEGDPAMREGGYEAPDLEALPAKDPTFNPYVALVRRPAGTAHRGLRFRAVVSLAVPPLPAGVPLQAVLRLPDGRDIQAPARPVGPAEFEADFALPAAPLAQVAILRLVVEEPARRYALTNPIAAYAWLPAGGGR